MRILFRDQCSKSTVETVFTTANISRVKVCCTEIIDSISSVFGIKASITDAVGALYSCPATLPAKVSAAKEQWKIPKLSNYAFHVLLYTLSSLAEQLVSSAQADTAISSNIYIYTVLCVLMA